MCMTEGMPDILFWWDAMTDAMMIIYVMPEQVGAKSQWSKANDIDIVRIYFIYTSNLHFIYKNEWQ